MTSAEAYRKARERLELRIHQDAVPLVSRQAELALQAAWFSGHFGSSFRTVDGKEVTIHSFGWWNAEAGPDFRNARISFDGGEPLRGDIELDSDVRDWERHGHHENPEFASVLLHLHFQAPDQRVFSRTLDHREVEQIRLDAATVQDGGRRPREGVEFSKNRPLPLQAAHELVLAAARYRLRRKAERFQRAVQLHGLQEALFQHLATALGYKANKIPFLLVAQRATFSGASRSEGESLLFGLSGFLEGVEEGEEPGKTSYLRNLWAGWWRLRANHARLVLPGEAWSWAGIRPANHPHRRMGALAALRSRFRALAGAVRQPRLTRFRELLAKLEHPFWSAHFSLHGKALARPAALLGASRIGDILANVFFPAAACHDEALLEKIFEERVAQAGASVRATARILGLEKEPAILRNMGLQQGLLQLAEDFSERPPESLVEAFFRRQPPSGR